MNKAAQALGRLARGKAKHYSASERARRRERLVAVRAKRWPPRVDLADANKDCSVYSEVSVESPKSEKPPRIRVVRCGSLPHSESKGAC